MYSCNETWRLAKPECEHIIQWHCLLTTPALDDCSTSLHSASEWLELRGPWWHRCPDLLKVTPVQLCECKTNVLNCARQYETMRDERRNILAEVLGGRAVGRRGRRRGKRGRAGNLAHQHFSAMLFQQLPRGLANACAPHHHTKPRTSNKRYMHAHI